MRFVCVAADAQSAHEDAVREIFQPAFGFQSVLAPCVHDLFAGSEGGVGNVFDLFWDGGDGLGAAADVVTSGHAVHFGTEIFAVGGHFNRYGRGESVGKAQVARGGHHGVERGRDVTHEQGMGVHAGDDEVGEQSAVVESAGHLAHAAAHAFHEGAVLNDVCRAVAALLGARSHGVVEGKFVLRQNHGAVDRLCGESDVVFAVLGAVAVIGGEFRYHGDLRRFGARHGLRMECHTA